jgi:hypothetical protein
VAEAMDLEGGCLCGAVRYRVSGEPYHLTHCHCTMCRRASGAPFVTWFSAPSAGFLVTPGELVHYRSSPGAVRSFCGRCGTQLTFQRDDGVSEIDITVCSLDAPETLAPEDHTYVRSRLRWVALSDRLPKHSTARDDHGSGAKRS